MPYQQVAYKKCIFESEFQRIKFYKTIQHEFDFLNKTLCNNK